MAKKGICGIAVDVFGTAVDWYGTITRFGSAASTSVDWNAFAISWLKGYRSRVELVRTGQRPWAALDCFLDEAFAELKNTTDLSQLSPAHLAALSSIWRRLEPWPDVIPGLTRLQDRFRCGALSNGNATLIVDIAKSASMPWDCVITADMPKKYKPEHPVYLLACDCLGPEPAEVLYIAAHKWDLLIGKELGMQTAYVPRPTELGPNSPPTDDPSPDPAFDFFANDFEDLAEQLESFANSEKKRVRTAKRTEHVQYLAFVDLPPVIKTPKPPTCKIPTPATEPNIEGPFYRAGAPWSADLAGPNEPGRRLVVRGSVVDRCGSVVGGATLDIWQATTNGHYDNDDAAPNPPRGFKLRGQLKTDPSGRFEFRTIWPGPYPIGNGLWRPSHIHVKIRADGFEEFTTQVYFKGDPYNQPDFAYRPSLELDPIATDNGYFVAEFDFVIAQAALTGLS